jgi:hypothetical protein
VSKLRTFCVWDPKASIRSLNLRRTLDDQAIAKLEGMLNDVINVIPASLIEPEDRNLIKKRARDYIVDTQTRNPPYKQIVADCNECNLMDPALKFKQVLAELG